MKSRMKGDFHVRFRESLEVKLLGATRLFIERIVVATIPVAFACQVFPPSLVYNKQLLPDARPSVVERKHIA